MIVATTSAAITAIGLALSAAAATIGNVVGVTLRQSAIPDALLGRVTAAYRLVVIGAVPLGAAAGGLFADVAGITAPFLVAAPLLILVTIATAPRLTTSELVSLRDRSATTPISA